MVDGELSGETGHQIPAGDHEFVRRLKCFRFMVFQPEDRRQRIGARRHGISGNVKNRIRIQHLPDSVDFRQGALVPKHDRRS